MINDTEIKGGKVLYFLMISYKVKRNQYIILARLTKTDIGLTEPLI